MMIHKLSNNESVDNWINNNCDFEEQKDNKFKPNLKNKIFKCMSYNEIDIFDVILNNKNQNKKVNKRQSIN